MSLLWVGACSGMVAAAAAAVSTAAAVSDVVAPNWDFKPSGSKDTCFSVGEQRRWVSSAVPEGQAPAAGWPVMLVLVTDVFAVQGQTCGTVSPGSQRKNYTAFATPAETMATCFKNGSAAEGTAAVATTAAANETWPPWPPHHHTSGCMYDQEAGALWDQRLKQYALANGIAVINVNPYVEDTWDAYQKAWDGYQSREGPVGGVDKPFLGKLFQSVKAGDFGPLNPEGVILRGWSGGAQMISWLFQVMASDPTLYPGVKVSGAIMLSGGSYTCYNDPQDPDVPLAPQGSCQGCTEGGASHCQGDPLCSSCTPGVKTYCGQCCPRNYTEAYYDENPSAWPSHPPVFLAQTSTLDNHADLCACRNYYDTLVAHGVKAQLVLVPEEDEKCFCVGTPSNPAAAGSPVSAQCSLPSWGQDCSTMGGAECCISHTMGFANMVVPATKFMAGL